MPENCVSIARPSIWGNPFVVGKPCGVFPASMGMHGVHEILIPELSLEQSLDFYRRMVGGYLSPEMYPFGHGWRKWVAKRFKHFHPGDAIRYQLGGYDLACFCPLDQPCHADVALDLANEW